VPGTATIWTNSIGPLPPVRVWLTSNDRTSGRRQADLLGDRLDLALGELLEDLGGRPDVAHLQAVLVHAGSVEQRTRRQAAAEIHLLEHRVVVVGGATGEVHDECHSHLSIPPAVAAPRAAALPIFAARRKPDQPRFTRCAHFLRTDGPDMLGSMVGDGA
jgi:hypothetical protein